MDSRIVDRSAKAGQLGQKSLERHSSPESTIDGWTVRLRHAVGLLEQGVREYDQVYHSRKRLLRRICELSITSERRGLKTVVRDLESILEEEDIVRFDPEVGMEVPRQKCASTPVRTGEFPPGLVMYIESPGYVTRDGKVVVNARVGESVTKVDSTIRRVALRREANARNIGLLLTISRIAAQGDDEPCGKSATS